VQQIQTLEPSTWVVRYADYLYSYALTRVTKSEVAEDLVQDTFLSALGAVDTFRGAASEKTWLIAILKRKIIDYYRKKSTSHEKQSLDGLAVGTEAFFDTDDGHWTRAGAPKDWKKDFNTSVERDEFYTILSRCLSKIPEKWSAAFVMKQVDGRETEEICNELDITPSNYWVIMHRAKLHLRDCMAKNWFE
jgi:RNA polymerase sigma-70 factor (TIGR02943 family)